MVLSAPSRSALLTARMSAISSTPALIACTSSPMPGASTTMVVWAVLAMSTSAWPTPTVSTKALKAGRIQHEDHVGRGLGQSAQAAARGHGADEDARIAAQVTHPHPVAQQRAAGEGAGGVHGHDAHGVAALAVGLGQRVDQRGLAGAGRAGNADDVRLAGAPIERGQRVVRLGAVVLDQRDVRASARRLPASKSSNNCMGWDSCEPRGLPLTLPVDARLSLTSDPQDPLTPTGL